MTDKADGKKPKKQADGGGTRCRVLVDCAWGKPDDVVTLSGADFDAAIGVGAVDPHPDAVAYADKLKG